MPIGWYKILLCSDPTELATCLFLPVATIPDSIILMKRGIERDQILLQKAFTDDRYDLHH